MRVGLRLLRCWLCCVGGLALGGWLALPAASITAQSNGVICVTAYQDTNQNGAFDQGEGPAVEVNISLRIADNVVIANEITRNADPVCFVPVSSTTAYTIVATSPFYTQLDPAPLNVTMGETQSLSRDIAMIPRSTEGKRQGPLVIPLTPTTRVLLALSCAGVAMALLAGVGMMAVALFLGKRKKPTPLPPQG